MKKIITRTRRRAYLVAILAGFCFSCADASSFPTLSNLIIRTSPIEAGTQAAAEITLSDADGIDNIAITMSVSGATPSVAEFSTGRQFGGAKSGTVPFGILLPAQTQPGSYTLTFRAIDSDGNESEPVTQEVTVVAGS